MIKNIPSPCCGSYGVLIKSELEGNNVWYHACCPECGFTTKDKYDNRPEAVYEYESMCINTWMRNRKGLLNWLDKKTKDEEDKRKRERIYDDLIPYLLHQ